MDGIARPGHAIGNDGADGDGDAAATLVLLIDDDWVASNAARLGNILRLAMVLAAMVCAVRSGINAAAHGFIAAAAVIYGNDAYGDEDAPVLPSAADG